MNLHHFKKFVQEMDDHNVRQGLLSFLYTVKKYEEEEEEEQEREHSDSFISEMVQLYKELTITPQEEAKRRLVPNRNTPTVHILFGDSATGSVRYVIKQLGLQESDGIISFRDLFSVGPIWKLHEPEGRVYREEWIRDHLDPECMDEDYRLEGGMNPNDLAQQIPEQARIVIWSGNSAHEAIGMRYVLYLLKEHSNQITLMNASAICERKYNPVDYQSYYRHTGEIGTKELIEVFHEIRRAEPLTSVQRKRYEQEWVGYTESRNVLRLWNCGEIESVEEDYLDAYLLDTVHKLQDISNSEGFLKAARVIGEAMGTLEQHIGDSFYEYRLRMLIYSGKLEILGVPKAMRYYSVRIKP